jgi:hypothetical protein
MRPGDPGAQAGGVDSPPPAKRKVDYMHLYSTGAVPGKKLLRRKPLKGTAHAPGQKEAMAALRVYLTQGHRAIEPDKFGPDRFCEEVLDNYHLLDRKAVAYMRAALREFVKLGRKRPTQLSLFSD